MDSIKDSKIQEMTITSLLIALVAVCTMMIKVPVVSTEGYIHLGDSMIFLSAVMFGKRKGAIAAGVGSAMADLLLGYTHWIIPTLIIKYIMGYIVGFASESSGSKNTGFRSVMAIVIGTSWMVFGYFIVGAAMKGSFMIAATSVPANTIQGIGGGIMFLPIIIALKKTKYFHGYVLK